MKDIRQLLYKAFQRMLWIIPLKNKVVASNFNGRAYGDNTKYIVEALHKIDDSIEIVWIKADNYDYEVPDYIKVVSSGSRFSRIYEYATAKVWVDTHHLKAGTIRRKGQLFIETWHGGLSIKKVGHASAEFAKENKRNSASDRTAKLASVFISNSSHIDHVYRDEFDYKGPIYKCGYPRSDVLFADNTETQKRVRSFYNIDGDKKILFYAPTFRDGKLNADSEELYKDLYGIDFDRLCAELYKKTQKEWVILVRLHPVLVKSGINICSSRHTIDATKYPDIQDLMVSCDAFISDYSSSIFDAAMRKVPCFTFAKDFDEYKAERGVEFGMEELPFPYAKNNDELIDNINSFSYEDYLKKWEAFTVRVGLHETGHAAHDVATKIKEFIDGKEVSWS